MAGPSNIKTLNSIHIFSNMKPPFNSPSSSSSSSSSSPSSSSLTSMKLKTLFQTFIFSHVYRIARALTRAKSVLIQFLKDIHFIQFLEFPMMKKNKQKKLFFGSFRLHYNWCSSTNSNSYVYYDASWNSMIGRKTTTFDEMQDSNELSKYLHWLEERGDEESCNEIDRLADLFIADCHEKFRLEKQESYRRFQEMMARSV